MTHKSKHYKISSSKYYLNNKDNIRTTCKNLDCKKTLYEIGLKDIKLLKFLQEETENLYLTKLLNYK